MKLFIALLTLSSCSTLREIPTWDGKLYSGDSKREGISRKQSSDFIPAKSGNFDSYICLSNEDFRSFYRTYVLRCKGWESDLEFKK